MQKRKRVLGAAISTMLSLGLLINPNAELSPVYGADVPVAIDETNFPDAVFRKYVKDEFDTDGDEELSVSEMESVTTVSVTDQNITDLTGIEYFINLEQLSCDKNNLSSLDVSQNTVLEYLSCHDNNLSSLDVSHNTVLNYLSCDGNELKNLDVSQNTVLERLLCDGNELKNLDVSQNTALEYLSCDFNNLSSLNVSQNTVLEELQCAYNQLSSLDVSQNTALKTLRCGNNKISLPLYQSGSEYYIDLSSLPLDTGRVLNPSVGSYNAENGHIEGLTLDINGSSLTYQYNVDLQDRIMEVTVNISGDPIIITESTTSTPGTESTVTEQDMPQDTNATATGWDTPQTTEADNITQNTAQNTPKTGDTMLPVWIAILGLLSTVSYLVARKKK